MRGPVTGSTPYETWVLTLRAWQDDPRLALDHLPSLSDDTFTPETYQRLVQHIQNAMDRVGEVWDEGVARAFREQRDPFDLGRELVSLRALLARQWQLASHPSLPEGLRAPLSDGVRRRASATQQQLEDTVRRRISGATRDRPEWERLLRTVRDSSLVRIADYSLDEDGRMSIQLTIPEVPEDHPRPVAARTSRFAHRRLLDD